MGQNYDQNLGQVDDGIYAMMLSDDYRKFPFIEIVHSTPARTVIPKLDAIISIRKIPDVIKQTPFQSGEFKQYVLITGFYHRKLAPLWPQVNTGGFPYETQSRTKEGFQLEYETGIHEFLK